MEITGVGQKRMTAKKAVLILILVTGIVRLVVAAITGLGFGESYYSMGVVHPQISYFDQPPLSFWMSWASVKAFGIETAFTLRLPIVLLFAGTTWLMYLLGKKLFGEWEGFWAAAILNLSAVFTYSIGIWLQPDGALMFFWLACALCFVGIFNKRFDTDVERVKYRASFDCYMRWIGIGLLLGLTTLSKYHAAFLFAGAGFYALSRKEDRHWVLHPGPYIALIINFIIAAPIFIWNMQNGWASFVFQSNRAASSGIEIHYDWFFRSIGGQMLWVMPWIWIPLVWQLYRCYKAGRIDAARWFCFMTAVLPIVFFTVVTLWASLGFHFHWQAPGYLMLFPPLGAAFYAFISKGGTYKKWGNRWIWLSVVVSVFFCVILQIHAATGFWSVLGPKWFGQLFGEINDPTMEGYDYDDIVGRFESEGWLNNDNLFVATDRWWLTGKVDWALRGALPIITFDSDPRNVAFFFDQEDLIGKDAIFFSNSDEMNALHRTESYFKEVTKLPNINIIRSGVVELELSVYYCKNYTKKFKLPYGINVDK